jgi:hypothetical protein
VLDPLIYRFRTRVLGLEPDDSLNPPVPLGALMRSYWHTFANWKSTVVDPYSRDFLKDPWVSLLRWWQFLKWMSGVIRYLGR